MEKFSLSTKKIQLLELTFILSLYLYHGRLNFQIILTLTPLHCSHFDILFFVNPTITIPFDCLTLQPFGRQRDAPGNFVHRGATVFATPSYLGQLVAWQRLGKLFLRVISNQLRYIQRWAVSFFCRVKDTRTCMFTTTDVDFSWQI